MTDKIIKEGLPSFLEGVYRLLGYKDPNNYDDDEFAEDYADALSQLQNGGGGEVSVFVVNTTPITDPQTGYETGYILDKTYTEIKEAYLDGQQVVLYGEYIYSNVVDGVETDFQHQIVRASLYAVEDHRTVDAETGDVYQSYKVHFSNTGLGNIPDEYSSESEDGYPGYIF